MNHCSSNPILKITKSFCGFQVVTNKFTNDGRFGNFRKVLMDLVGSNNGKHFEFLSATKVF